MAGNARGKLKEELEGILRNYSWINVHCEKARKICGDTHPELIEGFGQIEAETTSMGILVAGVLDKV